MVHLGEHKNSRYNVADCAAFGLLRLFPGRNSLPSKPTFASQVRERVDKETLSDVADLDLSHVKTNLCKPNSLKQVRRPHPAEGRTRATQRRLAETL